MLDPASPPPLPDDLERALIEALERGLDALEAKADALSAAHPEHADAIRRWVEIALAQSLGSPPSAAPAGSDRDHPDLIGPYRILDVLGEGGMGTVYRAEQQQPVKRPVALKLIKLGMDSKAVVARFEQERQALALMNHEGIARVFDCGTTERGQPFFVMELVQGVPLDRFCEQEQLSLHDRLVLMQQVCAAVQHAHQKGVIHRDLKPGNVLVANDDGRRQVKIIDFGLAKAMGQRLVEATLFTEVGMVVGTPEYMAPEQADPTNQDIDTRADIYSLGVMLYQVLVSKLPFPGAELRKAGMLEIQRILREVDPPKPSTRLTTLGDASNEIARTRRVSLGALKKALQGDLDWVVLKALEKERNRRYDTANMLAADLQRYLDHEPLVAGPPSTLNRLRKLALRHRAPILVAGLFIATLVIGLIATLRQKARADTVLAEFRQLSLVVRLDEAISTERQLYPAWPDAVESLHSWVIERGHQVVGERGVIEDAVEALAERATQTPNLASAGDVAELRTKQAERAWLKRIRAVQRGELDIQIPRLPAELSTHNARELVQFAKARSRYRDSRRIWGEEPLGLAAALAAQELVRAGDASMPRIWIVEALAAAWIANGCSDDARSTIAAGRRLAGSLDAKNKLDFDGYLDRLEKILADISSAAGAERISALDAEIDRLETHLARPRLSFDDTASEFLHTTLTGLIDRIDAFEDEQVARAEIGLTWARGVKQMTLAHPNAEVSWQDARAAIAAADGVVASQLYRASPVDLKPQWGLVPIGMNPRTGLWEFYHLRSAWDSSGPRSPAELTIPRVVDYDRSGDLRVDDDTGIVFVLIPGGTFWMGCQSSDPSLPNFDDGHKHGEALSRASVAPFFLARHELTRAQWMRLAASDDPSINRQGARFPNDAPIGPTHPVEGVDHPTCTDLLAQHGLRLPSAPEWEYACRAGTSTPWWTGSTPDTLAGAANVQDLKGFAGFFVSGTPEGDFDDGWSGPSPVGSFRANDFGLHDVHGNVYEWCSGYFRAPWVFGESLRVACGGGYLIEAYASRSALRSRSSPFSAGDFNGVRAARKLFE